jgi:hypothetical protein
VRAERAAIVYLVQPSGSYEHDQEGTGKETQRRRSLTLLINIAVAFLLSFAGNQPGKCNDFVFKKLLEGPPRSEYRGRYVNRYHEYSVVIPKGLAAYDVPDPANHEGFGLALGNPPESYIFVRGVHNSLEYEAPEEAARRTVEYLRQDGAQVESEKISRSYLGALDSVQLVVTYTCPGSLDSYIRSSITALSVDKSFLYELEIYSPAKRYERDRPVLDQIIKSWKVISGSVHLLEPTHHNRFMALMDQFMPKWRFCRAELNRLPVRREDWDY